ncbi:MAG: glycosyltransferase family 4 protein [Bacillota bacterium]
MAKVLVTAHLGRHFRIFGHYDYKVLLDMGHEVHIAANFNGELDTFEDSRVIKHQIDFSRSPFSFNNLKALKQLRKLFEDNYFAVIHCQSPSGGVITRLAAAKTRKMGSKILYTAHGLHFYKGAPLLNWIIYFNIEKVVGRYTDCIITINEEDYKNAKNKLGISSTEYIHGVGIDLNKYSSNSFEKKAKLREEYGYNQLDYILMYSGELSYRKHQDLLIETISILKYKIPNIKLLLAGTGKMHNEYEQMTKKLNVDEQVMFLGYRNDIANLLSIADIYVSSSRQEGLPVNIMEAMASGLPLVVTNCRGNRDLVEDGINGYVVEVDDRNGFAAAVEKLFLEEELRKIFSISSIKQIQKYSVDDISNEMVKIYSNYLNH